MLQGELEKADIPADIVGPREALLLDLRQDGEEGPRVQRDLRPHGDARDRRARRRRGDARLLRRPRHHPLALEADARPVQGLRRDAEAEPLPLAAHDRDRARRARRSRSRCARARCTRRPSTGSPRTGSTSAAGRRRATTSGSTWVKPLMDWQADEQDAAEYMRTLRTDLFDDEVYVFTPKGEVKTLPAGRDADRLRLRRAHGRRPQDGRRQGQRPDRPAALQAEERRLRRDPHVEVRARARRATGCRWPRRRARATRSASGSSARRKGETEAKGREALDQALKAQNLPYRKLQGSAVLAQVIRELGLQEGRGLLPRRRLRESSAPARSSTRCCSG